MAEPDHTSARPVMATQRLGTTPADLARAGEILAAGRLVAFPTETVYGLGADATSPEAVARLYAAKGRPSFNPLIAHVPDLAAAFSLGNFPPLAVKLAKAFWPGALTLVVPATPTSPVCELARAGLPSLAIRVPDHPVAQAILRRAGRPIAAPSANRSGHISPSLAAHVAADLDGIIDAIVDGGPTAIGVESTILGCLDDTVVMLRPGGIAREAIEAVLGFALKDAAGDAEAPLAPGRLSSHYAPEHTLRLGATTVRPGEACLGFGLPLPEGAMPHLSLNLSERGDPAEAAANLYRHLRALDQLSTTGIAVAPIPAHGLGEAILDRLARAAAAK
ncbi:MAG: tRNA threonylcarbamoyladenosine biosynthesis [Beijerinckiaceae bacterium]|nr:MAG: tRNA threonylcarbamoyladenosine biosynthesis [Beijerinckiaceae bacterium]